MTDQAEQDAPVVQTQVHQTIEGEGITGFSVTAGASTGFAKEKVATTIHYGFGRTVQPVDLVAPHADMEALASELVVESLKQHIARTLAEAHAATQQVQPQAQAPQAQPAAAPQAQGDGVWATGAKPNGGGTLRYPTTGALPTEQFKSLVAQQLQAGGLNPAEFEVWDNRVGQYGLESGNASYSVGSVKPVAGSPLIQQLGTTQGGNPKAALYVEFSDAGHIVVKPSREFEAVLSAPQQPAPAPQGWQAPPTQ